jgi:hypothetical protein
MKNFSRIFTFGIISLALVAVVLIAGCTGTSPQVQTTPVPTTSPAVTVPPATANVSLASAVTLGKMHGVMMEAIEEALAYPVLNSTEEKSDFEAKSAEFDVLAVQFESEAALSRPENADTKAQFDVILVKKAALVDAAGNFFTAYEKELIVTKDNVTVFEEAIDGFTSDFGPFTKAYFDRVSEADFGDDDHAHSALLLLLMHHDIIQGVEEAFGYVLLGDTEEKADFGMQMQDFDDAANAFVKSAYLDRPENAAKLEAYTTMMEAKEAMQAAASAMFSEHEQSGAVSPEVAGVFETEVDRLTMAYDALLAEVLKEL